jgi:Zn-dependent M28 family amino/carboxypeptidase
MIGRVDTISRPTQLYTYIIGSDKLSQELHQLNESVNDSCCRLDLDYRYNVENEPLKLYSRSDHYNFAKNNIPVIFYFTGLHEDYHKPTDTIDKLNFDKTAEVAKLVFNTAWEIANRKNRLVLNDSQGPVKSK